MCKICHLTSVHDRYDGRIFQKECMSLQKAGYNVSLVVADGEKDELKNGVRICSVVKSSNRLLRLIQAPRRVYYAALKIDADIYQIHDPELLPFGIKLKKRGKIVIYDSHEDLPMQIKDKHYLPKVCRIVLSVLVNRYLKKVLPRFDAVISVTPHIVDKLRAINPDTFMVTNYPILAEKIPHYSYEDFLQRKKNICYVGTIYNFSMHEIILPAINNSHANTYTLVGPIQKKYYDKLQKYWSSKIHYLGILQKKELNAIYSTSQAAMVISGYIANTDYKQGTLGTIKIFEYMMHGLPIICTDFTLWAQIIDKYKCGIAVNPYNKEEIQNAIDQLMDNPQEAYAMGQDGIKAVNEEFNWESQEIQYLNIIKKLWK